MNSLEKLIYMADQIARNLSQVTDGTSEAAVADHIAKYWDPHMKAMIFRHVEQGGEGLSPTSLGALRQLMEHGAPPPQTRATTFSGVDGVGRSDAG